MRPFDLRLASSCRRDSTVGGEDGAIAGGVRGDVAALGRRVARTMSQMTRPMIAAGMPRTNSTMTQCHKLKPPMIFTQLL